MFGLARTGADGSNGSGDYAIAFSTARNPPKLVTSDGMSRLFVATIEATEEAEGCDDGGKRARGGGAAIEGTREILRAHGILR